MPGGFRTRWVAAPFHGALILFHGGFPDRFELRRGGIATDPEAVTGELTRSVTSINPDVGWQSSDGMNLWAAAGYGTGEAEVDDEAADAHSSNLTQKIVAAGASGPLMTSNQFLEGGDGETSSSVEAGGGQPRSSRGSSRG